eukprot:CAMPEP_0197661000 /NCGR_PEP_ID=MMETSP1338-20131121/51190_1 /TAXON_ID=43686 ORGANISM="Pelagodinium beii, Strain RCC1491" /NCGR_SAMPLE_ID=MMETSP1338 /ASSEMBLY_ACC=CAM_ASM_000754 /LENGTH=194 /DNA_ID=CAMNT_0043238465 /DNA_START=53 /DNA_END=634 /DNA_ORIENTATION=-
MGCSTSRSQEATQAYDVISPSASSSSFSPPAGRTGAQSEDGLDLGDIEIEAPGRSKVNKVQRANIKQEDDAILIEPNEDVPPDQLEPGMKDFHSWSGSGRVKEPARGNPLDGDNAGNAAEHERYTQALDKFLVRVNQDPDFMKAKVKEVRQRDKDLHHIEAMHWAKREESREDQVPTAVERPEAMADGSSSASQ